MHSSLTCPWTRDMAHNILQPEAGQHLAPCFHMKVVLPIPSFTFLPPPSLPSGKWIGKAHGGILLSVFCRVSMGGSALGVEGVMLLPYSPWELLPILPLRPSAPPCPGAQGLHSTIWHLKSYFVSTHCTVPAPHSNRASVSSLSMGLICFPVHALCSQPTTTPLPKPRLNLAEPI